MRLAALVAALALITAPLGCGQKHEPGSTTRPDPAALSRPYRLYTHCGIMWARIRGAFWRASPELSDGSGNPPAGWGNPYQQGTLRFVNPTTAVFNSPAGRATFRRTRATAPPFVCS
jgi:hypothetical protein